jgi:hypothetical protein
MEDVTSNKTINIVGTTNRYMIKKLTQNKALERKYLKRAKWDLSQEEMQFTNQLKVINEMFFDNLCDNKLYNNEMSKIITQQINQKIAGYKNQDLAKKMFDVHNFIIFTDIITRMNKCELTCYYCKQEMVVLYDISREMKQWTVDRIDNNKGHDKDNFHLACLECNLKRRKQSDDKFLFTKQLNIVQKDKQVY